MAPAPWRSDATCWAEQSQRYLTHRLAEQCNIAQYNTPAPHDPLTCGTVFARSLASSSNPSSDHYNFWLFVSNFSWISSGRFLGSLGCFSLPPLMPRSRGHCCLAGPRRVPGNYLGLYGNSGVSPVISVVSHNGIRSPGDAITGARRYSSLSSAHHSFSMT